MGARNRQYAELMEIYDELEQATKLHRKLGCPVIDISELSIEETAHRVLRVLEDIVFYVLLTPIWIGLRVVAWLAEFRARRKR